MAVNKEKQFSTPFLVGFATGDTVKRQLTANIKLQPANTLFRGRCPHRPLQPRNDQPIHSSAEEFESLHKHIEWGVNSPLDYSDSGTSFLRNLFFPRPFERHCEAHK
jgi:hypothetical protein